MQWPSLWIGAFLAVAGCGSETPAPCIHPLLYDARADLVRNTPFTTEPCEVRLSGGGRVATYLFETPAARCGLDPAEQACVPVGDSPRPTRCYASSCAYALEFDYDFSSMSNGHYALTRGRALADWLGTEDVTMTVVCGGRILPTSETRPQSPIESSACL